MKTYAVSKNGETQYISAPTAAAAKFEVARGHMEFLDRRDRKWAFKGLTVRVCKDPPPTPWEVAAAQAEIWNGLHPVGTVVNYWRGLKEGDPSGTGATLAPAQRLADVPVVWIAGCRGCIHLSHVEVKGNEDRLL